jgi:biopolymer transport protein ExbB
MAFKLNKDNEMRSSKNRVISLICLSGMMFLGNTFAEEVKPDSSDSSDTFTNPYGLMAVISQGDWIARCVLIILLVMSLGTWIILLMKYMEQSKLFSNAKKTRQEFWSQPNLESALSSLDTDSAFRYVAEMAVTAKNEHHGDLATKVALNTWIEMSFNRAIDEIQAKLSVGLSFLATVGSTAPFVGLFGTVWGIYHALTAIGIAGQASIDKVAGPVGESLIMTALGLAVAVPAVLSYNWLVRRNKSAMAQITSFSADLEKVLLGGTKPA